MKRIKHTPVTRFAIEKGYHGYASSSMKCKSLFSGKNKENISTVAKSFFVPSMLNVNLLMVSNVIIIFFFAVFWEK